MSSTQVLLDLRADINASNNRLVDDVIAMCEGLTSNPQKLRKDVWQLLKVLDRDTIILIADRIGIATYIMWGYTSKPLGTNTIRKRIISHYACPSGCA